MKWHFTFKWENVVNGLDVMGENRKINFLFFFYFIMPALFTRQGQRIIDNLIQLIEQ